MLVRNIQVTDTPVTIRIGDTCLKIKRIGERSVKLAVDAPQNVTIDFSQAASGILGRDD